MVLSRRSFLVGSLGGLSALLGPKGHAQNAMNAGQYESLSFDLKAEDSAVYRIYYTYNNNALHQIYKPKLERIEFSLTNATLLEPLALRLHGYRHQIAGLKASSTLHAAMPLPSWGGSFLCRLETASGFETDWQQGGLLPLVVADATEGTFDEDVIVRLHTGEPPTDLPRDPLQAAFALPLVAKGFSVMHKSGEAPSLTFRPYSRVRLRLYNLSYSRIVALRLDGIQVSVLALDGRAVTPFLPARNLLLLAPGARTDIAFDVLPKTSESAPNTESVLRFFDRAPGSERLLMSVKSEGEPRSKRTSSLVGLPEPALPPAIPLQGALRPFLTYEKGQWRFAAQEGGAERSLTGASSSASPLFRARLGQTVVVGCANLEAAPMSVHVEGASMRLLHPLDDGWEPYWLDTMMAAGQKTVRGAFVADSPGLHRLWLQPCLPGAAGLHLQYEVFA